MKISTPAFLLQRYILLFFGIIFGIASASAQLSITCPDNITENNDLGDCGAIVTFADPIITDGGTNVTITLTSDLPSGSYFEVGTTQIDFEVTNDEGESEECSFYINVQDTEHPVFDCPDTMVAYAVDGTCSAEVVFDIPDIEDNCQVFWVDQEGGQVSGSSFAVGEHFLDFRGSDSEANEAFCRVILTVYDTTDPVITCPEDIIVSATASCEAVVNYTAPVGTDGCTAPTTVLTSGIGSGGTFPLGTTTEIYTVTDADGNEATCSFDITVIDDIPPTIICPIDQVITLGAGECEAIITFADPDINDNCPDATILQTGGDPSGSSFGAGKHTVEFTATDGSGNTTICSYSYSVIETTDPEIECPEDIVVGNTEGDCGAYVTVPEPIGSDNCDVYTMVLQSGIPSGDLFPLGTTTNTYLITDASENTATCSVTITVNDTEAPIIDCADITVPATIGTCGAEVTFADPDVSDNCSVNTISQTDGPVSGSIFQVGATSIEYTATDDAGNSSTCTFDIIVEDEEAPEITCPADISFTIPDNECETTITYPDPVVDDNCAGVTWSVINGPASGDVISAGEYIVELEVADAAGNTSFCSFNIELLETSNPEFICPDDLFYPTSLDSDCEGIAVFNPPVATDDCSVVTVDQTGGPLSGSIFPAGATTVEFTATDEYGNTDICSFDIIIISDLDPELTCPEDIDVPAEAGVCEAVVNYDDPTSNDDCGITTTQRIAGPASGSAFPLGETTITYEITDLEGNTGQCSFTVTVNDEEAPEITCPGDVAITLPDGECEGIVTYALPTATDNCGIANIEITEGFESGELFPAGVTTVTYTVTDDAGNTSTSCSFDVTVTENIFPTITCPDDMVVDNDSEICGAIVNYTAPFGEDNCDGQITVLTAGLDSGSEFPIGTTTVTWTVTDLSGNQATCSFDVTVNDTEAPVIDCEDITVPTDLGTCEAVVTFADPAVSDNCGVNTFSQTDGPASGSVFPIGSTTIEYTATDDVGNSFTCTFDIIVEDQEVPEITCPADIVLTVPNDECETTITYPDPVATDNCPGVSWTVLNGPISGDVISAGDYIVEFEATDAAGNTTFCSFNIDILETSNPVIVCPDDLYFPTNLNDDCEGIAVFNPPTATDDCSSVTVAQTSGPESGDIFPAGATTVEFTATDAFGNTDVCSFDIIIVSDQALELTCSGDIEEATDPGVCEALVVYNLPTSNDNCGLTTTQRTEGPASGTIFPLGETTITYEITDLEGNTGTCSFTVNVVDEAAPAVTCPTDILIALPDGDCEGIVTYVVPTATDNCGVASIELTSGFESGESFPVGTTVVTYVATDNSGNTTTCSFNVKLTENIPPTIECPEDIEVENSPGLCGAIVNYTPPFGEDNCPGQITVLTGGLASGSEFPVGTTVVTFRVTDKSGNQATCSFNVTVNETEAPVFDCPEPIILDSPADICGADYTFTPPEVTDNCTANPVVTQTAGPASGTTLPLGETAFTFTAEDEIGNISTCTYTVTVVDVTAPVFTLCPSDATVYVDENSCTATFNYEDPLATDACSVTLTQTAGPENGSDLSPGVYNYEITASDGAGNTATCTFTYTVLDNIAPVLTCPASFETCETNPEFDQATAEDNCDIDTIIQISGPESGSEFPVGDTEISFVAHDLSGNTDTCSFIITVLQSAPEADAGEDIELCDEQVASLTGNDPEGTKVTWTRIAGTGVVMSPNKMKTFVTELEDGISLFVYTLDPQNGCEVKSDTLTITVGVTVDVSPTVLIMHGSSTTISASTFPEGGVLAWTPSDDLSCTDCENPVASPRTTTVYTATYTTSSGCQASDSVIVRVFIELPNTFTPDGDGVNDVWNIPEIEKFPNAHVVIYNRWGNTVYESTGYHDPWDGTQDGKELPTGSYFYIVDYKVPGQEVMNGTVNIIR